MSGRDGPVGDGERFGLVVVTVVVLVVLPATIIGGALFILCLTKGWVFSLEALARPLRGLSASEWMTLASGLLAYYGTSILSLVTYRQGEIVRDMQRRERG